MNNATLLALAGRLPARLDPVRPAADPVGRQGRHPRDRIGQYRRDQRASHRVQGAGGRDAASRCGQRRGGGLDRPAPWPDAVNFAAAGALIGHLYPVWLASRAARAWRPCSASSFRSSGRRPLVYAVLWIGLLLILRISSVAGMAAAASAPVTADPRRSTCSRCCSASRCWSSGSIARISAAWPGARNHGWAGRLEALTCRPAAADPHAGHRADRLSPAAAALRQRRGGARRDPRPGARGGGRHRPLFAAARPSAKSARSKARSALSGRSGRGFIRARLAELEDAPPLLTAKGDLALLERPMVAIVGARNASAAACRFARGLAHDLGRRGGGRFRPCAGSTARRMTDRWTAERSRSSPAESTSSTRPRMRRGRSDIAERGLLIAEMPPGTEPRARHFPYRNRIIAGLAAGTVVVEAAPQSGSLITARLAAEAGREVMAVPGSPLDPRAQGCNQLIRDGATLIQTAADVIEGISQLTAGWPADAPVRSAAPAARRTRARSRLVGGCSGRRRCRSTRSSASGAEPGRCSWCCSNSTLLAGSTATPGTRSAAAA